MNDFHQYLLKSGIEFTEAEFAENQAWVKDRLHQEIYTTAFGVDEARKLTVRHDPMVAAGVDAMPKAKALIDKSKPVVVRR
jgi:hypothetical protein